MTNLLNIAFQQPFPVALQFERFTSPSGDGWGGGGGGGGEGG